MFLSPAWNQGIRETKAPCVLLLNPDTEMVAGTLADYVAVATAASRRRHRRARWCATPTAPIYESGRPFPSVVDAAGHAFLGAVHARQPFTRRYQLDGLGPATEREVDWVSGAAC